MATAFQQLGIAPLGSTPKQQPKPVQQQSPEIRPGTNPFMQGGQLFEKQIFGRVSGSSGVVEYKLPEPIKPSRFTAEVVNMTVKEIYAETQRYGTTAYGQVMGHISNGPDERLESVRKQYAVVALNALNKRKKALEQPPTDQTTNKARSKLQHYEVQRSIVAARLLTQDESTLRHISDAVRALNVFNWIQKEQKPKQSIASSSKEKRVFGQKPRPRAAGIEASRNESNRDKKAVGE